MGPFGEGNCPCNYLTSLGPVIRHFTLRKKKKKEFRFIPQTALLIRARRKNQRERKGEKKKKKEAQEWKREIKKRDI